MESRKKIFVPKQVSFLGHTIISEPDEYIMKGIVNMFITMN